jgi:hypothetical protein
VNYKIVFQLVNKDWQLYRGPLTAYVLAGMASLWIFTIGGTVAVNVGGIVLISLLAVIGIHMIIANILHERKEQTLAFVMTLPVSFREYTLAKVLSIGIVAGGAWALLYATVLGLTLLFEPVPNGVIPYFTMVMLYMLVIYAVLMAVALVTESEAATVVTMVILNTCISIFMIATGSNPAIGPHIEGPVAVWNATSLGIVAIELLVIVLAIAGTFYFQGKKRSYL